MTSKKPDDLSAGLDAKDQRQLEIMIDELRQNQASGQSAGAPKRNPDQDQIEDVMTRLADLTEMVLRLDRQVAPLMKILQLTHEKSERLNQRLDAVINALSSGKQIE